MANYPLILDLNGWEVAVVGGGDAAAEKIRRLVEAGARVTVISPGIVPAVQSLVHSGAVRHVERRYADGDLEGARLAFAVTADLEVNGLVAAEAARRGVPVNVVDDPRRSTCLDPAWFSRGPLAVAVSTGGAGEEADLWLRRKLELEIPALYGQLAEIIERYRERAGEQIASRPGQRAFLRELMAFLDGPEVHEDLARGHLDGAVAGAKALLEKHAGRSPAP